MCSNEQGAWSPNLLAAAGKKISTKELPEKIQISFTICLKYYLEHTYMKNYSSFAENSNLMGPPGFLLAVFGNCAPRPYGIQTLEGEKSNKPFACVERWVFLRQLSTLSYLDFT